MHWLTLCFSDEGEECDYIVQRFRSSLPIVTISSTLLCVVLLITAVTVPGVRLVAFGTCAVQLPMLGQRWWLHAMADQQRDEDQNAEQEGSRSHRDPYWFL